MIRIPINTAISASIGVALSGALATGALMLERDVHVRAPACNTPAHDSIIHLTVPGQPFQALPTSDGCWVFVSLARGADTRSAVAVIYRRNGEPEIAHVVPVQGGPTGMALTHDEKVLVVASGPLVSFLDVSKLQIGNTSPLLGILEGDVPQAGRVYANVSPDDAYAFVSDERAASITVIDLAATRKGNFDKIHVVGRIPTGGSPIALTFSNDGRWMYTTSQIAPPKLKWPSVCAPQAANDPNAAPNHAQGAIIVVDMKLATTKPEKSVAGYVAAGCSPVRLVLSPEGTTAYVTSRGDNAVLAFATNRLLSDSAHARIGKATVGTAPVGVAVVNNGKTLIVTNSNRFAGSSDDKQSLSVLDISKLLSGGDANIASIPAGGFPRELRVTANGRVLIATNFSSQTVEFVDMGRMAWGK